jgi:cell division protein FtsN
VVDQDGIDKIASLVTPETTVRKSNNKESDINEEKKREKITPSQANNMDSTTNKGERYFVQVGAYTSVEDAKSVQSKAENQGIALNILSREGEGTTLYRVRTKALQPADAERLRNTIKANGMEAQLVKAQ